MQSLAKHKKIETAPNSKKVGNKTTLASGSYQQGIEDKHKKKKVKK